MTNKNKNRIFISGRNFIFDNIKSCKIKFFAIAIALLIALLTGIIVAIRTHKSIFVNDNFGVVDISSNQVSPSTFFTRLLSMLVMFLLLFGCSTTKYLFPVSLIFLAYRSYLLGLNACLMIVVYGFSGVVISVIVALPCQLLVLATLCIFYILMSKTFNDCRCFGSCSTPRQKTKIALTTLIILILLCIIESLLLLLFSAKIILVI